MIYHILNEIKIFNGNAGKKGKYPRCIAIAPDRGGGIYSTPGKSRNFDKYPYFKYFNKKDPNTDYDKHFRIAMAEPVFVVHNNGNDNWKEGFDQDEKELLMEILYSKHGSGRVWDAIRQYTIDNYKTDPTLIPIDPQ